MAAASRPAGAKPLAGPAAALLLGVVHAGSFAPWPAWWAQTATLAGLLWLVWQAKARDPGRPVRTAFGLGMSFGLGWFVAGLYWLYISMHDFGGMPAIMAAAAVVLFAGYLALFPSVVLWVAATGRADLSSGLRFAAAWTASEWLRGWLFTGFPWLSIGYAHIDGPLAGWASLLGVYGVGGLAALLAFCAALAVRRRLVPLQATDQQPSWLAPLIAVLLLAGGQVCSAVPWTTPIGSPISVRLLQGNVPQAMKFSRDQLLRSMNLYADLIAAGRADVTVLPETAWTTPWETTPPDIVGRMFAPADTGAVVIGVPTLHPPDKSIDPNRPQIANSMVMLRPANPSTIIAQYDKHHLVPFGEFVPDGFHWFVATMNIPLGDFLRGRLDQAPFEVAGQRLAMNICYEDLFGEELLAPLRDPGGASILVNASNIGWFGHSLALPQHLAISRMRAIETGRPMLRATNTGVTAYIDARGHTVSQLAPFTVGVLQADVQSTTGLTPFVRAGNALALALAAAAGLAGWLRVMLVSRNR